MPKCIECQADRKPGKVNSRFCSTACKAAFHNRRAKRGALLYDAMMLWRKAPEKRPDFPERMQLAVTTWLAEDEAAGRPVSTKTGFDVNYDLPRLYAVTSHV